jgi:hypothetical protein
MRLSIKKTACRLSRPGPLCIVCQAKKFQLALPIRWGYQKCLGAARPRCIAALANGLDTALHITALLHGLYVGVIATWLHWHDQAVGSHWHVQMLN